MIRVFNRRSEWSCYQTCQGFKCIPEAMRVETSEADLQLVVERSRKLTSASDLL